MAPDSCGTATEGLTTNEPQFVNGQGEFKHGNYSGVSPVFGAGSLIMGSDMHQDREWHLDKKVPIALIVTMAIQTMAVVWWAAKADNRLDNLERAGSLGSTQAERIVRLETKMDTVADAVNDLKVILRSRNAQ